MPSNSSKSSDTASATFNHKTAARPPERKYIYTAGRPPWFDFQGQPTETFVIGICGGSASGKTTVTRRITETLGIPWVSVLSMDSFYKVLTPEQHEAAIRAEYNFDHPNSFDFDRLHQCLKRLREGKSVDVPVYNFVTHSREKYSKQIYGANVVIFEGIMAFVNEEVLKLIDLKIFVDTDGDVRLARRLRRDTLHRGRSIQSVLEQYMRFVKPAFEQFIAPCMTRADMIIPWASENQVAINMIVQQILQQFNTVCSRCYLVINLRRGINLRSGLVQGSLSLMKNGSTRPKTLHVLPESTQARALHTIIRNRETPRDDLIFYSNRLMRLLFEWALSFLPYRRVSVDTPQGTPYDGVRLASSDLNSSSSPVCRVTDRPVEPPAATSVSPSQDHLAAGAGETTSKGEANDGKAEGEGHGELKLCAVSILRAGETMEATLREICKDVPFGKILIQTNPDTKQPELHFLRLPNGIAEYDQVLLLDSTVASGAAASMALRVLLDHDVLPSRITLISLLMSNVGVHSIAYVYPQVRLVTSAVDPGLSESYHIIPGLGNFGNRYFGTELEHEYYDVAVKKVSDKSTNEENHVDKSLTANLKSEVQADCSTTNASVKPLSNGGDSGLLLHAFSPLSLSDPATPLVNGGHSEASTPILNGITIEAI